MNVYLPPTDWQRTAGQVPSDANAFDLRELVGIFVRRLPIVCGVPFLVVLVAMSVFFIDTPVHRHGFDPDRPQNSWFTRTENGLRCGDGG